jgi:hypothetical protein
MGQRDRIGDRQQRQRQPVAQRDRSAEPAQQKPAVGGVPDDPVRAHVDDPLVGLDGQLEGEESAEGVHGPLAERDAEPHEDDPHHDVDAARTGHGQLGQVEGEPEPGDAGDQEGPPEGMTAGAVGDDRLAGRLAGRVGGLDGQTNDDGAPEQDPPEHGGPNEKDRRHAISMSKPERDGMI